jgi:monomeric sarcosine oxidase
MYQQRIVIVGAGIIGLSTAYALLKQGIRHVTVFEQESVDHSRSTSHGPSRLLRFEYGSDVLYSRMVELSLHRWRRLERVTGRTIFTRTGVLILGTEADNFTLPSYRIMRALGQPSERLSEQQCRQRFPQFTTHASDILTYNAEAGILHASTCLRTIKDLVIDLGGEIHESTRVIGLSHDNQAHPIHIHLASNEILAADRVILATGPWVHRLIGNLYLPVQPTRQYVLYFAGLPTASFGVTAFPAFIAQDLYGFPLQYTHGTQACLKATSHSFGAPIDPDDTAPPAQSVIAHIVSKLHELIPALQRAELAHVDTCMYDVTPDQDFILDHLPHDPRIILGTGLTGHGFKFGLLLGELLSSMVCNMQPVVPLERFQLARFKQSRVEQGTSVV